MKKTILICYLALSGTILLAQPDSATAYHTGKAIADTVAGATGNSTNPIYIVLSSIAPVLFGWIWHATHLKRKYKNK